MYSDTTILGRAVRVFFFPPDWSSKPELTLRIATESELGLTGLHATRRAHATQRYALKFEALAAGAAALDLIEAGRTLGSKLAAVPVWTCSFPVDSFSARILSGQFYACWDPGSSSFEIVAHADMPGGTTKSLAAPLLFGDFDQMPKGSAETDTAANITLEIAERSPWEYRMAVNPYGSGWAAKPDWTKAPKVELDADKEPVQIGAERELAEARPNMNARQIQSAGYLLRSAQAIRQALAAFVAASGSAGSFPLPTMIQPVSGTSSMMARFSADSLKLSFTHQEMAETQVSFIQELGAAAGYVQQQADRAFLYEFKLDVSEDVADRWTNWDEPLTVAGNTFAPHGIAHRKIRQGMKPQNEKCEIELAPALGSLLHDMQKERLDHDLILSIWETNPSNLAAGAFLIFQGTVSGCPRKSGKWKAEAALFCGLLDQKIPRFLFQRKCNHCLFSAGCGLSEAAWTKAGTIARAAIAADMMSASLTLDSQESLAENWFAGGLLATGSGRASILRQIVSSSACEGGAVTLQFSKPLWADLIAEAGQAFALTPGCDGEYSTCKDKFSNGARFGAFPFIPDYIEQRTFATKTGK